MQLTSTFPTPFPETNCAMFTSIVINVAFLIPGSSNRSQAIQFQFKETTLQSPMWSLSWNLLELGSVIHPNAFPISTIVQINDFPKAYSLDPAPWNTTPVAIAPQERTIYNYYLKNMVLVNSCTPTYINYSVESDMSCDQKIIRKDCHETTSGDSATRSSQTPH